jgi:tetrahydromethanopterin S-methyltransferase subunit B
MRSKKTPDAAKVEKFLDDLRSGMPETPAPLQSKPGLRELGAAMTALVLQGISIGLAVGVGLRIVRLIAGF